MRYLAQTVVITTGTLLRDSCTFCKTRLPEVGPVNRLPWDYRFSKGYWPRLGRLKTVPAPYSQTIDRFFQSGASTRDEPVPYFSYWKEDLFHVEHSGINLRMWSLKWQIPPGSVLDKLNGQMDRQSSNDA